MSKPVVTTTSTLRHRIGKGVSKPVHVASTVNSSGRYKTILAGGTGLKGPRVWEHVPVAPSWDHARSVAVARLPQTLNGGVARSNLARPINALDHAIPVRAPLAGWIGVSNNHRVPVRILPPSLPRVR